MALCSQPHSVSHTSRSTQRLQTMDACRRAHIPSAASDDTGAHPHRTEPRGRGQSASKPRCSQQTPPAWTRRAGVGDANVRCCIPSQKRDVGHRKRASVLSSVNGKAKARDKETLASRLDTHSWGVWGEWAEARVGWRACAVPGCPGLVLKERVGEPEDHPEEGRLEVLGELDPSPVPQPCRPPDAVLPPDREPQRGRTRSAPRMLSGPFLGHIIGAVSLISTPPGSTES